VGRTSPWARSAQGERRSWKLKKAEKVIEGEDSSKPSYEVEVTKGAEKAEVVFDPAGTVIKEEVAHPKAPHKK
jgi:hypothetical protein